MNTVWRPFAIISLSYSVSVSSSFDQRICDVRAIVVALFRLGAFPKTEEVSTDLECGLFTGNDGLQYVAAAYDSDRCIVDLDSVDDRTDIQPPLGTVVEATSFNRMAAARPYSAGRVEASDPDLIMKLLATSERTATRRRYQEEARQAPTI